MTSIKYDLIAVAIAVQGAAILTVASVSIWNTRRLAEISRAVTRIEKEIGLDCDFQNTLCVGDMEAPAPASIVHPADTVIPIRAMSGAFPIPPYGTAPTPTSATGAI
jgi:hypothetical protein